MTELDEKLLKHLRTATRHEIMQLLAMAYARAAELDSREIAEYAKDHFSKGEMKRMIKQFRIEQKRLPILHDEIEAGILFIRKRILQKAVKETGYNA